MPATFTAVPLGPVATINYSAIATGFPTGNVTLGDVPFEIPTTGKNAITNDTPGSPANGKVVRDIPVNVAGVTRVNTLINTAYGQAGPKSYLSVEFLGSAGGSYTVPLVGNVHIRDVRPWVWTNSINAATTKNVFRNAEGYRIDMQTFTLPAAFANQTLTSIRLTDTGAHLFQRLLLYGVTVSTDPVAFGQPTLPDAQVGRAYSQTLSATGPAGPFTFAVTSGALPAGLTLSAGGLLAGTPTAAGTTNFTITATSAGGVTGSQSYTVVAAPATPGVPPVVPPPTPPVVPPVVPPTVPPPAPPVVPPVSLPSFAVGSDVGGTATVNLQNSDGSVRLSATPFGADFTGGVRAAAADFTGDGVPDLVVGTGPGAATSVRVLDGVTGAELFGVAPFEAAFTGGVFVAAGDVTGDGVPDLVVTPDEGGGPRVRVFSGRGFTQVADFFGIDDPAFRGGARAAVGDVSGDGVGDLLVAAGFGGGPRLAGFDGPSVVSGAPVKLFSDFFAYEPALRNGVYLAAGDLDGDGFAEVLAGAGPGGGPRVAAFAGRALVRSNQENRIVDFFAGDATERKGVRLAAKNLDGDPQDDLVTGSATTGVVTTYSGKTLTAGGAAALAAFDAMPGREGVYVG